MTPHEILQLILRDEHATELVVALVGSSVQTAQQAHNLEARVRAENDLLLVALESGRYFHDMTRGPERESLGRSATMEAGALDELLRWGEALEKAAEKYKSADDVPASHIESHWGFVRDIVRALRARKSLRRCAHCRVELPSDEKFINDVYCEDVCHTRHCEIKDG